MRHLVRGKKLGRNKSHRVATMKALSCSLIENKSIQTTVAKAKELRKFIEPVITKAKEDTTHNRRQVFSALQDKHAVSILFDEIAPEVGDRPGGYTRVLKLGFRLGDSAEMALIELVDFSDYQPEKKSAKKKRTRRAGKSNKPTTMDTEPADKKAEEKIESKADKEPVAKENATSDEAEKQEVKSAENQEKKEVVDSDEDKSAEKKENSEIKANESESKDSEDSKEKK